MLIHNKIYDEHDTFVLDESIEFYEDCPMVIYCEDLDHLHYQQSQPFCTVQLTGKDDWYLYQWRKIDIDNKSYMSFSIDSNLYIGNPLPSSSSYNIMPMINDGYVYASKLDSFDTDEKYLDIHEYDSIKITVNGNDIIDILSISYGDSGGAIIWNTIYDSDGYLILQGDVSAREKFALRFKINLLQGNTVVTLYKS